MRELGTSTTKGAEAPERTCLGCGNKRPKRSLWRLVLNAEGQPTVDQPQTAPGRGAYLCGIGCLKAAAKRKAFGKAFKKEMKSLSLESLEAALQTT